MRVIDLAVQAGRKRQSPRTGFVHYYPGLEGPCDTIPIFENFCMAFALFRLKTTESVKEGKELVERLLPFQANDGNFPVYLHDYPQCWDFNMGEKVAPVIFHILKDFGAVLNVSYKEKLGCALAKIALKQKEPKYWFEQIISDQQQDKGKSYPIPYNRTLQMCLETQNQERGEPQILPIEYILAEKDGIKGRLLKDHIHQLHAAILYPFSTSLETEGSYVWVGERLFWTGTSVHSLYGLKKGESLFELPENVEMGKHDLFEVIAYCDISPETSLYINGKKGMVFYFGDTIEIQTPDLKIYLRFDLVRGEGDFCGHISRGNRPGQISCQGIHQYDAYDWQIGIRTLRRRGACTIRCNLEVFP